ncbi:macrolide family glycosyltransferase [Paenibacillus hexagrammi]|uniref:Glycosyl transferase n=1 Tax=Paenibacillus hexagrammi TaxID=2908839 RepID=A0ABY3SEH8_9BACL|nr:macrolide family glycosyltransferase [Paenibacillus sp. YPD9-1]UJF31875.1 glycosyl transferase [Paenibacillus sp. YPD9-1]
MSKVLFINGPASGHIHPTLGLVEELIAHGEEIVYVASEEYRTKLERLGARFVAYDNFLADKDPWQLGAFMPLVNLILASYEVILPCILQLAETNSFDYLIHDSMYGCGNLVADLLQLPHVSTCSSFVYSERLWSKHSKHNKEFANNYKHMKEFFSLAKRMEEAYGLHRKLQVKDVFFNKGDLNILFTSKELQPEAETLDPSYQFVGPCINDRRDTMDLHVDQASGKKIVYVSLGTVFNNDKIFYGLIFEALRDFDGQVIVSVGERIDMADFDDIPPHFMVRPYIPQLTVLQQADLFITHGGMNSVHEALYFDVPLIVVPIAADQPIVASRIAELGAGRVLDISTLTVEILRESVQDVLLTDTYRHNSSRIGLALRQAGGQQAAIEQINQFKLNFGVEG